MNEKKEEISELKKQVEELDEMNKASQQELAHYIVEVDGLRAVVKAVNEDKVTINSLEYRKLQDLLSGNGLQNMIKQNIASTLTTFFKSNNSNVISNKNYQNENFNRN